MTAGRESLHADPVIDVVLAEALETGGVPEVVAVIDDAAGEFADALLANGAREVRLFADGGLDGPLPEGAVEAVPDAGLFHGASLVVGRLPKALAELDDLAEACALNASTDVRMILGAREKHLVHAMNDQLTRSFARVRASRGLRKSRALFATTPTAQERTYPRISSIDELDLRVAAHGGAFAGATLDLGTRALLERLPGQRPGMISVRGTDGVIDVQSAVDLGCGTGILANVLARTYPDATVVATDRSWAACASAEATAEANGFGDRIRVIRSDSGDGVPSGTVDLVLCNPPFHDGRDVDPGLSNRLFAGAARMLRPGGLLVTVFNSHLLHRRHLERIVGETRELGRTPKFTVTVTSRR